MPLIHWGVGGGETKDVMQRIGGEGVKMGVGEAIDVSRWQVDIQGQGKGQGEPAVVGR